jgi:hypothetical protein
MTDGEDDLLTAGAHSDYDVSHFEPKTIKLGEGAKIIRLRRATEEELAAPIDWTAFEHKRRLQDAGYKFAFEDGPSNNNSDNEKDKTGDQTDARETLSALARPLTYYRDFNRVICLDWAVKGIFAKGHNSYAFGPPGGGKSALLGSVAAHLGAGSDWRGFKIKERKAAVYFALERADLVQKRIWAECQRNQFGEVPVAVCPGIVNLMDRKCVDMIVGTILKAEDDFGLEVALAILDTFGKAIAAGGGDEDKARDQNPAWANLRRVHELLARWHTIHVAAIGHTGKDESRGPRGSNAADGDNDVSLQIKEIGDIKDVSVYKANELPEGPLLRFKMEPYDTGIRDEDGKPIEIWIPASEIIPAPTTSKKKTPKLTSKQQNALDCLVQVAANGMSAPASTGLPFGCQVATLDQWREELIRRAVIDGGSTNPQARFSEIVNALQKYHVARVDGIYVWPLIETGE